MSSAHDRYVDAVLESQFAEFAKLEAAVRANLKSLKFTL
jgi:hypothetical protein